MSIAPHVLQQISARTAALAAERESNQEETDRLLDVEINAFIAKIPDIIARTTLDGGSYADVMTIIEGRDFTCPGWKDRTFSKSPRPDWLHSAAAAVYAWCEEAGLQPFMAPYRGFDRQESRIVVQWAPERLQSSDGAGSFLEKLCEKTAAAQARKAAERHRWRIRTVRSTIAEMHRKIDSYSREFGSTEIEAASTHSYNAEPDLRGDSWIGDVIAYCESLGLTVRIETNPDHSMTWPEDTWRSVVYVSWEKGMKIQRPR
ncbi:MAG: hypothetical protein AB7W16_22460 [Candidatus Obscuribacterales bacterium]